MIYLTTDEDAMFSSQRSGKKDEPLDVPEKDVFEEFEIEENNSDTDNSVDFSTPKSKVKRRGTKDKPSPLSTNSSTSSEDESDSSQNKPKKRSKKKNRDIINLSPILEVSENSLTSEDEVSWLIVLHSFILLMT